MWKWVDKAVEVGRGGGGRDKKVTSRGKGGEYGKKKKNHH